MDLEELIWSRAHACWLRTSEADMIASRTVLMEHEGTDGPNVLAKMHVIRIIQTQAEAAEKRALECKTRLTAPRENQPEKTAAPAAPSEYMEPWAKAPKVQRLYGCSVCGKSGELVERRDWIKGLLAVCITCDDRYSNHWD